jgi:hypothetical protein
MFADLGHFSRKPIKVFNIIHVVYCFGRCTSQLVTVDDLSTADCISLLDLSSSYYMLCGSGCIYIQKLICSRF